VRVTLQDAASVASFHRVQTSLEREREWPMITLRRNTERHLDRSRRQQVWLTFCPQNRTESLADGFGALAVFNEILLSAGGRIVVQPGDNVEVITYVHRGSLARSDSTAGSSVLRAGEFQRTVTGPGIRHKENTSSKTAGAHVFRISLHPQTATLECAHEQTHFTAAQRRNVLCLVASSDGREGSLRMHQDSSTYSSILDPGHHLVHELLPGRSAWLHILYGHATLNDIVLTQGDGAGVTDQPSVSLTGQQDTEILLVDLGPDPTPSRPFSAVASENNIR
jgi:redox-sensitive bicupin YhaK (pirin superfamily)